VACLRVSVEPFLRLAERLRPTALNHVAHQCPLEEIIVPLLMNSVEPNRGYASSLAHKYWTGVDVTENGKINMRNSQHYAQKYACRDCSRLYCYAHKIRTTLAPALNNYKA
jgi:hypothetical protein